jgi:hypothetical protein
VCELVGCMGGFSLGNSSSVGVDVALCAVHRLIFLIAIQKMWPIK